MPHRNIWEPGGVVKTFTGVVTADELVSSIDEIARNDRCRRIRWVINDFNGIEVLKEVNDSTLEQIAVIRFGTMYTNPNIMVLVLGTQSRVLALAAATKRKPLVGSNPTKVFATQPEARRWIEQQNFSWPPPSGFGK